MCPGCWEKRAQTVKPNQSYSRTALQTTAFVLGLVALLPIPAIQLAALIVSIVALVKAGAPELRHVRWKPAVGLGCAIAGILLDVLWVVLLVNFR
jgi:hypothetical protein